MNQKTILVSLLAVFAVFLATTLVSASTLDISLSKVEVDGVTAFLWSGDYPSVALTAGETVPVKVLFTYAKNNPSAKDAENVEVSAWFSGHRSDSVSKTLSDLIAGKSYNPGLALVVPSDIDPEETLTLFIRIESDEGTFEKSIDLTAQRTPFDVQVVSVGVDNRVEAGTEVPVEIVVKNIGKHELDDLFAIVKIADLGIERKVFIGNLDATDSNCDNNDDDEDCSDAKSATVRFTIPSSTKAGNYQLEVLAYNDDAETKDVESITVVSSGVVQVISPITTQNVAIGESASYDLILVNPGKDLKVFNINVNSADNLDVTAPSVVVVPAGSSQTVKIEASSDKEGTYNFAVVVMSGTEVVDTKNLTAKVAGTSSTSTTLNNPVVILSVVLAVVFVVLLIVLIVLLTRKPEKEEGLSESYY